MRLLFTRHHRIRGRLAEIQSLLTNSVITWELSAATTPLRASTCDAACIKFRTEFTNRHRESQVPLLALHHYLATLRKELGHSGLFMPRRHYSYVLLYVVGHLMLNLRHIQNSKDFLQIIPWDMELRVDIYIKKVFVCMDCCSRQCQRNSCYYGQYLQLLDCQRRARSLGYSWFQPTEMDLYLGMKMIAPPWVNSSTVSSQTTMPSMRLFHRTVLYEDSNHALHWFGMRQHLKLPQNILAIPGLRSWCS